jgi:hypothetical protein
VPLANYNDGGLSSSDKIRFLEFLNIKFTHNLISIKEYNKQMFRIKIKFFIKRILGYMGYG